MSSNEPWCQDGELFMAAMRMPSHGIQYGDVFMCVDNKTNTFYSFELKLSLKLTKWELIKLERSEKFMGKGICITGTLDHPRDLYKKIIENHSGKFVSSVTKSTSFLVVQDKWWTSEKTKKARSLGVPIVDMQEFIKMLKVEFPEEK